MDPATLSLIGMGAASASSFLGQERTNRANVKLARENRDWQERMSGSAYQRAMLDLEKAGLNPLLAVGAQATTPGGNVAQVENSAGKGVSSALEAQRISREFASMESTIALQDAQAQLLTVNAAKAANELVKSDIDPRVLIGKFVKPITDSVPNVKGLSDTVVGSAKAIRDHKPEDRKGGLAYKTKDAIDALGRKARKYYASKTRRG